MTSSLVLLAPIQSEMLTILTFWSSNSVLILCHPLAGLGFLGEYWILSSKDQFIKLNVLSLRTSDILQLVLHTFLSLAFLCIFINLILSLQLLYFFLVKPHVLLSLLIAEHVTLQHYFVICVNNFKSYILKFLVLSCLHYLMYILPCLSSLTSFIFFQWLFLLFLTFISWFPSRLLC